MSKEKDVRNATTPVGFLSYPHLAKPDQYGDDPSKARYQATIVVSGDGADVREIVGKAVRAAAKDKFPGVALSKLKMPIEEADAEYLETFGLEQGRIVKTSGKARPKLFDKYGDPLDPDDPKTFSEYFYPGALVRAKVWAYAWTYGPKKGVSLLLKAVQFYEDAEPIGSSSEEVTMEPLAERPQSAAQGADFPESGDPVTEDHWPDDDDADGPVDDDDLPF